MDLMISTPAVPLPEPRYLVHGSGRNHGAHNKGRNKAARQSRKRNRK